MSDNLKAINNYLLIAIPERYKQVRTEGTGKIHLLAGEDNMAELIAQIKSGRGELRLETQTEASVSNLIRTGLVLSIPPQLTDQMVLCAAPNARGYRTFADIIPLVALGDTVYLDHSCLIDENEIMPGIYRVPYSAVICTIHDYRAELAELGVRYPKVSFEVIMPIGGYVLLSRVWADDVKDVEIEGRMRKVRYGKHSSMDALAMEQAWIEQIDVPPLPNEGVVAHVDYTLNRAPNELRNGHRVLIADGQALVETISGTEYLCVRHDYCVAIIDPIPDGC